MNGLENDSKPLADGTHPKQGNGSPSCVWECGGKLTWTPVYYTWCLFYTEQTSSRPYFRKGSDRHTDTLNDVTEGPDYYAHAQTLATS